MSLALMFATGMLLGRLLTYGMVTALTVYLVVRVIRTGRHWSWVKVNGRVRVLLRKRKLCRIAAISM